MAIVMSCDWGFAEPQGGVASHNSYTIDQAAPRHHVRQLFLRLLNIHDIGYPLRRSRINWVELCRALPIELLLYWMS